MSIAKVQWHALDRLPRHLQLLRRVRPLLSLAPRSVRDEVDAEIRAVSTLLDQLAAASEVPGGQRP